MTDCIFTRLWDGLVKKQNLNSQEQKIAYLKQLRTAGSRLWQSYQTQNVQVDYSDIDVQNAYLLRYFPFYAQPLKLVLDKLVDDGVRLPEVDVLRPVFFGCGPAPELVGLLMHLSKHRPLLLNQVKPCFVDKDEWHPSRGFVLDCVTPEQNQLDTNSIKVDITDHTLPQQVAMSDCHLAVFQNCLNEVIDPDHAVKNNIKQIAQAMPVGSIVIITDRPGYGETKRILQDLKSWAMGNDKVMAVGNLTLEPQPNELHGEILDHVPQIILDNFCARGGSVPSWAKKSRMIFAGRKKAMFLALAMQRCSDESDEYISF